MVTEIFVEETFVESTLKQGQKSEIRPMIGFLGRSVASLSRILISKQIFRNFTMMYHLSREAKIFGLLNHESRLNF